MHTSLTGETKTTLLLPALDLGKQEGFPQNRHVLAAKESALKKSWFEKKKFKFTGIQKDRSRGITSQSSGIYEALIPSAAGLEDLREGSRGHFIQNTVLAA